MIFPEQTVSSSSTPLFYPRMMQTKSFQALMRMASRAGNNHTHAVDDASSCDSSESRGDGKPRGLTNSSSSSSSSHHCKSDHKTPAYKPVSSDFRFTPYTVIIGKGKNPRENMGNRRLRILATTLLQKYQSSKEKRVKTAVVNQLIDSIHGAGGNFVKQDRITGNWLAASDQAIREKCGYVFRDLLGDNYRSSSKSKAVKRLRDRASTTVTTPQDIVVDTTTSSASASTGTPSARRVSRVSFTGVPPLLLTSNLFQGEEKEEDPHAAASNDETTSSSPHVFQRRVTMEPEAPSSNPNVLTMETLFQASQLNRNDTTASCSCLLP